MFGEEAGFFALAAIMMILGVAVLGNLNTEVMSQQSLGLAFWRIIISAGILAMVVSLVNILAVSQNPNLPSSHQNHILIPINRPSSSPTAPRASAPATSANTGPWPRKRW
jgi:hypothetical protein